MTKMISKVGVVLLAVLVSCGCERDKADHGRDENKVTEVPNVEVDQYSDFSFDIEDDNAYPCLYLNQQKNIVDFSGVESAEVLYIDYSTMVYQFLAVSNQEEIENPRTVIQTNALEHCENLKLLIIDDEWRENYLIDEIKDGIEGIKERDIVVCCYQESQLWEQLSDQGVACVSIESADLDGLKQKSPPLFVMEEGSLIACGNNEIFEHYFADKKIRLPGNIQKIGNGIFAQNLFYESIEFPETLVEIDDDAFLCSSIKKINFKGDCIKRIGDRAFSCCGKLSSVILPENLEYIGENAFAGTKIRKIIIPKSVKAIENGAFSCVYLSDVTLLEGLEYIGEHAFSASKIQGIIIPKSVKRIEYSAFQDCKKLSEVTLSEGLEYIGYDAFKGTKIRKIIIPKSVKAIEEDAFDRDVKLIR